MSSPWRRSLLGAPWNMPGVLAIVAGTPAALEGRSLVAPGFTVERLADPARAITEASSRTCDLLVLAGLSVELQQEVVSALHEHPRWRVVPVLYVIPPVATGFIVPHGYRPEIDAIARGDFGSPAIEARIRLMAREGTASAEMIVAGPFELDAHHGHLRCAGAAIELTARESAILGLLLENPNRTVRASEFIERGWGTLADECHLQILRRHMSNLRRKLNPNIPAGTLRTVRGHGYRFELRSA